MQLSKAKPLLALPLPSVLITILPQDAKYWALMEKISHAIMITLPPSSNPTSQPRPQHQGSLCK
jgi:hypothetical protein